MNTLKVTLRCRFDVTSTDGVVWMRGYNVVREVPGGLNADNVEHSPFCDRTHREVTNRPGDWSHSIGRDPFHNAGGNSSVPF